MTDTGYACKQCGAPVLVYGEGHLRTCEHEGTIVTSMEAVASGESQVN